MLLFQRGDILKEILPIAVICSIIFVTVFRNIKGFKITISQAMLGGALILLFSGTISPLKAFHSINFEVIGFLFGMFIIGEALHISGLLSSFLEKYALRAFSNRIILLNFIIISSILSAVFMNDTIAIVGVPAALYISSRTNLNPRIFLLSLAFSITIGSVFSPIGNPQNLIIAVQSPYADPFVYFFANLFIPTSINLLILYYLISIRFKRELASSVSDSHNKTELLSDRSLAGICKVSVLMMLILIVFKIVSVFIFKTDCFGLIFIALVPALPILIFSKKRMHVIKSIDYSTLLFFISMFIVMQSVFDTSLFSSFASKFAPYSSSPIFIMASGIGISQLISNVPFVSLLLPVFKANLSTPALYSLLAASSTIAGNLMILGAASNVIIIQRAEKRGETVSFMEFFRIGLPLTLLNAAVYLIFYYISALLFKN